LNVVVVLLWLDVEMDEEEESGGGHSVEEVLLVELCSAHNQGI